MNLEYPLEPLETSKLDDIREIKQSLGFYEVGLTKSNIKKNWHKGVYRESEDDYHFISFHGLCKITFKRDNYLCQACFTGKIKLRRIGLHLTAHHILPREYGGQDNQENLITLCNKCHDEIESLKLKSREEIYGYFTKDKRGYIQRDEIGTKWTQWVYGGRRKPR